MKKKILKPKVVGKRGKAIPLGDNFYYMQGPKHSQGGIPIGKNPKTGIEVEGEEVMHITPKEVQVFSSVPFLNGESPAQKVLGGENPTKVFKQQENFKDRNKINDDGTKKKAMGGISRYKAEKGASLKGKKKVNDNSSTGERSQRESAVIARPLEFTPLVAEGQYDLAETNQGEIKRDNPNIFQRAKAEAVQAIGRPHPNLLGDIIGTGTNIAGAVIGYKTNKKMLNNMRYASQPTPRKATKLKTRININPQLNKLRETAAAYERDVDANTASSAVALQRKQRARLAAMLNTNELYANKENAETQLINKDRLNQQIVADKNITEYNQWAKGRSEFANAIADKKSENKMSLINNITNSVQDLLTRGEARRREDRDMALMEITNPAAAKVLKEKGFESNRSRRERRKRRKANKD